MSNDHTSIHEFDFQTICEYFSTLERQGPGSPDITRKALGFIKNLTPASRLVDLGCGTGGQTMVLAQHAPGTIIGIDLFSTFIDLFNANAARLNLQKKVTGRVGSMEHLPFSDNEFDVIWSEGAIYSIGFERGINEWKRYLKTGGYLAVSEASWFTDERPLEIERYWTEAYPEIDTIPNKIALMQKAGYEVIATFPLPEECWTTHFYLPQVKAQKLFLQNHPGNTMAEKLVAEQRYEAEMYDRYKAYYGYTFYIGRKL